MALIDTRKTILSQTKAISKKTPATFVIEDAVEGNMEISFLIEDRPSDDGSYTRIQVVSNNKANIIISNVVRDKRTVLTDPMRIGTYKHNDLFLLFDISPILESGYHEISVRFFTEGGAQ